MFTEKRENKTEVIKVAVTPTHKEAIHKMADERGLTVSALVLLLLDNEYSQPSIPLGSKMTQEPQKRRRE